MKTQLPVSQSNEAETDKAIECENCHAIVKGSYCSECGQSVESSLKYFWTVVLHILDDIFSFDSRASRTLYPLLFKPGFLTNEYFAGRRVHYVPPLRLYLFVSIIFFLSLKVFINTDDKSIFHSTNENLQISEQIQRQVEKINNELPQVNGERKVKLEQQLAALNLYLKDINDSENDGLVELARQVAELELKQVSTNDVPAEPLTTAEKIRYQTLKDMLTQHREQKFTPDKDTVNGKGLDKTKDEGKINLTIGNQADGSLKLPFLSEAQNQKLAANTKVLETKAEKLLQSKPEKIFQEALEKLPQIMFVILPIFALLLKVMYMFSGRLYLEHLTVALHSHSFIFLNLLLVEILTTISDEILADNDLLRSSLGLASVLFIAWIPIYLFIMQKRVYRQGILMTSIKFFAVGIFYMCILTSAALVAFIWGVLSIA